MLSQGHVHNHVGDRGICKLKLLGELLKLVQHNQGPVAAARWRLTSPKACNVCSQATLLRFVKLASGG